MSAFVRVIVDRSIRRELDYSVPETLRDRVAVGSRVRVPFREKAVLATVVATLEETPATGVKSIEALLGEKPALSPVLIELARWIASYYCCPIETVIRSVLPQVIRRGEVGWKKQLFVRQIKSPSAEELSQLQRRAPRQAELLQTVMHLASPISSAELLRRTSLDQSTLRALVRRGWIELRPEAVARDPHGSETFVRDTDLTLNEEQTAALRLIETAIARPDSHPPILLHGVTGSGKTEIYLQAIRTTVEGGQSAIVLVPEISLTPQTVERFKSRFADNPDRVAVLHSHLSEGERHDEWHKLHTGRAQIVIGARSAVFAPLEKLGLIVVDE
jgi:primosomal protein N' (replication factor Y)